MVESVVTVRLHPDTRAELDRLVRQLGQPRSAVLRALIEGALEDARTGARELSASRRARTKLRNGRPRKKHGRR